jgi:hypothetical protein
MNVRSGGESGSAKRCPGATNRSEEQRKCLESFGANQTGAPGTAPALADWPSWQPRIRMDRRFGAQVALEDVEFL